MHLAGADGSVPEVDLALAVAAKVDVIIGFLDLGELIFPVGTFLIAAVREDGGLAFHRASAAPVPIKDHGEVCVAFGCSEIVGFALFSGVLEYAVCGQPVVLDIGFIFPAAEIGAVGRPGAMTALPGIRILPS
jgi:hypothetical protein